VELTLVGKVKKVPKGKPPLEFSSHFYRLKIGFAALVIFAALAFISSVFGLENSNLWFDLVKLTTGYLFGTGISAGFSR